LTPRELARWNPCEGVLDGVDPCSSTQWLDGYVAGAFGGVGAPW
jgi:hypothetical protein